MSHTTPLGELAHKLEDFGKTTILSISLIVIFTLGAGLGTWIFGPSAWAVSLAIGFFCMASVIPLFLVSVPEITGLITVNAFTGAFETYGPGLHLRFPWEQVEEGNYINLRQITREVVETYPSLDALMKVKWIYQYTPRIKGLPKYISADDNSINEGLKGTGSSTLAHAIALKTGDVCKRDQEIIEGELRKSFEGHPIFGRYEINLDNVQIADIDYDETVQKARSTRATVDLTIQMAEAIRKDDPSISRKEAMNFALIISDKVKKNVFEVEGLGPVAQAILNKIKGGAP